jgi:branched-chain amino acid transport system permease protein
MDWRKLEIAITLTGFLLASVVFRLLRLDYIVYVMVIMLLYAYLGQCWNIAYGYAGLLSFGHAAFYGLGAYVSTLLLMNFGISPWLGMFVGGGASALLGLVAGIPTLRLRGAYFAVATIAIAEVVRLLILKMDFLTNGALGLLLPTNLTPLTFYFRDIFQWFLVIFAMLIVLLFLSYRLERSKLGMAFRAMKENEAAAASLGVDLFRHKLAALAISAFFTGIGGVFFAQYVGYIRPDTILIPIISDEILMPPILGGVGTLLGPVIGAVIFIVLRYTFLATFGGGAAGAYLILYGALLVLVVMFLPEGIYPTLRRIVGRYLYSQSPK